MEYDIFIGRLIEATPRSSLSTNDSFDRSDTDGFLSQWAGHLSSQANSMKARLAENGNQAEFPAIFDLEGNLVPAKYIRTVYGWTWALLSSEDPTSSFVGY